jgi:hypothetical protein
VLGLRHWPGRAAYHSRTFTHGANNHRASADIRPGPYAHALHRRPDADPCALSHPHPASKVGARADVHAVCHFTVVVHRRARADEARLAQSGPEIDARPCHDDARWPQNGVRADPGSRVDQGGQGHAQCMQPTVCLQAAPTITDGDHTGMRAIGERGPRVW